MGGANSASESISSSFEPLSSSFALPSTTRSDAKAPARQVQDQPLFREIEAGVRGEPSQRFRGDVDRYGNVTMRRVGETDPERVYRGAWDRSGEFKIRDQSGREARVYSE